MTVTSSGCPECGGTGARGCGAGWHDGKPDAPSPLDEPTAAPTHPTREQVREVQFVNELGRTITLSVERNAESVTIIGTGPDSRVEHTWTPREADHIMALLAGEGTAQPDPCAATSDPTITPPRNSWHCERGRRIGNSDAAEPWAGVDMGECPRCYGTGMAPEAIRRLASGEGTASQPGTVTATYTNWQGETAERRIIPERLWYGVTGWHPDPGWLLDATDADKWERRVFALSGFHSDSVLSLTSRASGEGTAPQVPAEEVRDEIESLRMTLAELDSEHAASSRVASALAAAIGWETPGELWVDKARHLAPLAAELEAARELRAARNGETTKEHRPAEAVHPGEMLQDELEERGMTQASLAEALGHASPATVSRLCNGRADMNAATALGLERALGTSAELWLRLQMAYDLHHARVRVVAADGAPQPEADER